MHNLFSEVTVIDSEWLPSHCMSTCSFTEPLDIPPPTYDEEKGHVVCSVNATFGKSTARFEGQLS